MTLNGFRLAHAGNVRLDASPRDVGPVDGAARDTLRDATLIAFESLVTTCLDREVDLLLLAGNTFDTDDCGLRAGAAFRDGLECLDEAGIRTWIVPGAEDPIEFWSRFGALPASVSVLGLDGAVLSLERNGTPLATLADGPAPRSSGSNGHGSRVDAAHTNGRAAYRLLVVDPRRSEHGGFDPDRLAPHADYVALLDNGPRRTLSSSGPVVHHAGHVEARSKHEGEVGGMTLVELDRGRDPRLEFVPTGVVRRERCNAGFDTDQNADDAAETLARCLGDSDVAGTERVWIVEWHVGRGYQWLRSHRADLEARFEIAWEDVGRGVVLHRWIDAETVRRPGDDPVEDELRAAIRGASVDVEPLLHRIAATTERTPGVTKLVERLRGDVDRELVLARAESLASGWLERVSKGGHAA